MAPQQKGFSWSNIGVGAIMNMFEVSRGNEGKAEMAHQVKEEYKFLNNPLLRSGHNIGSTPRGCQDPDGFKP